MLIVVLFSVGVMAVAVAGAVGYMTARSALRPLDQVTDTALQITRADDLSRRITLQSPPTGEVGRLTLAFNETLERLESLFETQRRFLADVSHELRTPLTTIRGNIDLMRHMGEADPASLDAITSEVDRMTRLVRDLLFLAQAETGKLPLAQEIVELDTLMLEVFQQARILAKDQINVSLGREDQARVLGDRDRLKQVLLNLVANAIDHTPSGGKVDLSLTCEDEWARVIVSDTGPGIPQEDIPIIFERFRRLDRSGKPLGSKGAGLGLSIAFWITRIHGGRIEVTSEVGQGAEFSVWLPRFTGGSKEQAQVDSKG
jgi:signal transduction histidine kinase